MAILQPNHDSIYQSINQKLAVKFRPRWDALGQTRTVYSPLEGALFQSGIKRISLTNPFAMFVDAIPTMDNVIYVRSDLLCPIEDECVDFCGFTLRCQQCCTRWLDDERHAICKKQCMHPDIFIPTLRCRNILAFMIS